MVQRTGQAEGLTFFIPTEMAISVSPIPCHPLTQQIKFSAKALVTTEMKVAMGPGVPQMTHVGGRLYSLDDSDKNGA